MLQNQNVCPKHSYIFQNQTPIFLGLANSYRKIIANFAKITAPLYYMLKKNIEFIRDKSCQNSFKSLKQTSTSDVVLEHPDYESPFFIFTDASDHGVGAVLMQQDKKIKNLRPIAFFLKSKYCFLFQSFAPRRCYGSLDN